MTETAAAPTEKKGCHLCIPACLQPDLTKPLLPTQQGCKTAKMKPVCDSCGCVSKPKLQDGKEVQENGETVVEEHMFGSGKGVIWNCKQQSCCGCGIFLFIYFVVFGIIQWLAFHWATENCGKLDTDYNFPGGGMGKLTGGGKDNLCPRNSLIVAREPSLYGEAFDTFNSTNEGQMVSAPVGTWFRTWGPWFWTYTYQDTLNSKATVYMRPTLVGMTGAMSELKVMRCDGKGEVMKFTEGTSVFGNRMREFFRTNTGRMLKILINGKVVSVVEETFHGQKSATFRTVDEKNKDTIGSCILRGTNNQGYNEWFLKNDWDSPIPFYMTQAIAVNFAFKIANQGKSKHNSAPSFLASLRGMMQGKKQIEDLKTLPTQQSSDIETNFPSASEVPAEQSVKV